MPDPQLFNLTPETSAPIPISKFLDANQYSGSNPDATTALTSGATANGQPALLSPFGLSEYTNANFVHRNTIFTDTLPQSHKWWSPYPRLSSTNILTELLPELLTAEDGISDQVVYVKKERDGERIDHFLKTTYAGIRSSELLGNTEPASEILQLDDRVYEDYARLLWPRAVGYSIGLLDYFFRGKLDLALSQDPDDGSIIHLEGKNDSSEKLDGGTLELYADDSQGNRNPLMPLESTIISAEPGQEISVPYRLPASAESFIAVYKGKLGNETPNGDFPGAVIGKVVEGVQLEQLFRDSVRWYFRNSDGVYPTEILVNDVAELQWGDNDNTLVGRSRLGPGEPNLFYAYQINRPLGASNIPLRTPSSPMDDQPTASQVVDLEVMQQIGFPLGINVGTEIQFSQRIDYKQYLISWVNTAIDVWDEEFSIYRPYNSTNPFSDFRVDLGAADTKIINRTYPVILNVEQLSSGGRPYNSFNSEFNLTNDGRILAVIQIALTDPEETVSLQRLKWEYPIGVPSAGNPPYQVDDTSFTVNYDFPSRSVIAELFWVVIDVTNGQVIASTAPPVISISYNKDITLGGRFSLPSSTAVSFQRQAWVGGPRDGEVVNTSLSLDELKGFGNLGGGCPNDTAEQTVVMGDFGGRQGPGLVTVNPFRAELVGLYASSTVEVIQTNVFAALCSSPGQHPAMGFRVTDSHSNSRFSRPFQLLRTVPGSNPEQFIINSFHFPLGNLSGTYKHVKWSPGNQTAETLKEFNGNDDYYVLGATPSSVLVQSYIAANDYDNGPKILEPMNTADSTITMSEVEWNNFYLLDPDYLYDADALKFFTKEPMSQITTRPRSLASTVIGNPRGRYHLLRLRGLVN